MDRHETVEERVVLDPSLLLGFDQVEGFDAEAADLIGNLDAAHNKIGEGGIPGGPSLRD